MTLNPEDRKKIVRKARMGHTQWALERLKVLGAHRKDAPQDVRALVAEIEYDHEARAEACCCLIDANGALDRGDLLVSASKLEEAADLAESLNHCLKADRNKAITWRKRARRCRTDHDMRDLRRCLPPVADGGMWRTLPPPCPGPDFTVFLCALSETLSPFYPQEN